MKVQLILCSMLALPAGVAMAASSPWNGTWKLDQAQSHFAGGTMTITQTGSGFHYADGSTGEYDFAADGKERKSWSNRMATWTAPRKNTWNEVVKVNGKVQAQNRLVVSADGKTLTETWTANLPDGSKQHGMVVMTRVSGDAGLVGTWRASKVENGGGPDEFIIEVPASGRVHYQLPDMKLNVEGPMDGSDLPITGPTAAPGLTISFQPLTPTKTRYTMKMDGKVDSTGEQTLAADGRSFTDVNWTPGKEDEKTTGVYVRQ